MERQISARAASLERIAGALERISSSLDLLAGVGVPAGHSASAASDAARAGVWRRTVATPRMGTTQSVVARLEAGERIPTLVTLERVAAALDAVLEVRLLAS
jgi:hypothetical protein